MGLDYDIQPLANRGRYPWDPIPLIQDGLVHEYLGDATGIEDEEYQRVFFEIDLSDYPADDRVVVELASYDTEHTYGFGATWGPRIYIWGQVNPAYDPFFDNFDSNTQNDTINFSTEYADWHRHQVEVLFPTVGLPANHMSMNQKFIVTVGNDNFSPPPGPFRLSYRIDQPTTLVSNQLVLGDSPTASESDGWIKDSQVYNPEEYSTTGFQTPWDLKDSATIPGSAFQGLGLYQIELEGRMTGLYGRYNTWDDPPIYADFTATANPVGSPFTGGTYKIFNDGTIKSSGGKAQRSTAGTSGYGSVYENYYGYGLYLGGTTQKVTIATVPNDGESLGLIAYLYQGYNAQALMRRNDAGSDYVDIVEQLAYGVRNTVASYALPPGVLAAGTKLLTLTRPRTYIGNDIYTFTIEVFYDTGSGVTFLAEYNSEGNGWPEQTQGVYTYMGIVIQSGELDDYGIKSMSDASKPTNTSVAVVVKRNGLVVGPAAGVGGNYFSNDISVANTPVYFRLMDNVARYIAGGGDANFTSATGPAYFPIAPGDEISFSIYSNWYDVAESQGGRIGNADEYSNGFELEIRNLRVSKLPAQMGPTYNLARGDLLPLGATDTNVGLAGDAVASDLTTGDLWVPMGSANNYQNGGCDFKDLCVTDNGDVYCLWQQRNGSQYGVVLARWNGSGWSLVSSDVWGRGLGSTGTEVYSVAMDTDGTNLWIVWGEEDGTTTSNGSQNWHVRARKYTPGVGFTDYPGMKRFPGLDPGLYSEIGTYTLPVEVKCSPNGVPWILTLQWDKTKSTHVPSDSQWPMYPCVWYFDSGTGSWHEAHPPKPENKWDNHPDKPVRTAYDAGNPPTYQTPTIDQGFGNEFSVVDFGNRQMDLTFCHADGPSETPSIIGNAFQNNWGFNPGASGTYPPYDESRIQQDLGYWLYTWYYSQAHFNSGYGSDVTWKKIDGSEGYDMWLTDNIWGPDLGDDIVNASQVNQLGENDYDQQAEHIHGYGEWTQGLSLVDDGTQPILSALIGIGGWGDTLVAAKITPDGPVAYEGARPHRGLEAPGSTWWTPGHDAIVDSVTGQVYFHVDVSDHEAGIMVTPGEHGGNPSLPAAKTRAASPYSGSNDYSYPKIAIRDGTLYVFREVESSFNQQPRLVVETWELNYETYQTVIPSLGVIYSLVSLAGLRYPQRKSGARHTIPRTGET